MDKADTRKKGIPFILKVILVVLIIVGIVYIRRYYNELQHPYKDYDILGTWDYDYSLTFDEHENLIRSDKDRFSLEMYIDTEIVFNDDGTFTLSLAGVDYSGTWTPDAHVSYLFHLTPDTEEFDGVIYNNEIRWDNVTDNLFMGISKDKVPLKLRLLFQGEETYREIYCKTWRERTKTIYINNDDSDDYYEDDEWEDDNGLPFNYHP